MACLIPSESQPVSKQKASSQACLDIQMFHVSQTPPQIRPFSQEDFIKTLDQGGPQLTSVLKGDWIGLYR